MFFPMGNGYSTLQVPTSEAYHTRLGMVGGMGLPSPSASGGRQSLPPTPPSWVHNASAAEVDVPLLAKCELQREFCQNLPVCEPEPGITLVKVVIRTAR